MISDEFWQSIIVGGPNSRAVINVRNYIRLDASISAVTGNTDNVLFCVNKLVSQRGDFISWYVEKMTKVFSIRYEPIFDL